MNALKQLKYSPFGPLLTLPQRLRIGTRHLARQTALVLRWWCTSREWTNFSLNFSPIGLASLNASVATLLSRPYDEIAAYTQEFLTDHALSRRLDQRRSSSPLRFVTDGNAYRGKCLLNYVLVRASRARTVFEAGTAQGLSAVCMAEALRRNAQELHQPCRLYTVDLQQDRSLYLAPDDADMVTRLVGDSVEALRKVPEHIDLFLHDTLNDPEHTARQFATLLPQLAPGGVIHTSWFNDTFVRMGAQHGMRLLPLRIEAEHHWYSSHAGLAVRRA